MKDLEGQMSSSSLLEKEIALEKLEREREQQAALYSTLTAETQGHKTGPSHKSPGFRGLMIHRRTFRNRILMLTGVLFFIVYLIYHAVK
ncbi:hypothetical protein QPK87_11310 [Kamptonema cortianum]|nr:hypothetical protein [Oscillatoria laete-virens]MDK3157162.1 hypothetical protein [Kamptonema cortianum]MDL5051138.1 hypothetical protein [Oscillatoria amoena NRMC-F 0135]MDL5055044.1 hypothetical protein [Oscillatoria laete-virens NRMC-F 0139]